MKTAILLSGGVDSTSLAYWYRNEIKVALTVDYGQKSALAEIEASRQIAKELAIIHEVLHIDCSILGSGEMSDNNFQLSISPVSEWWPYRNQLLITFACMKAINYDVESLIIGTVKSDKTHVDGSKRFIKKINQLVSMQEGNINIVAPAINKSSIQLIKAAEIPTSLLYWSHSCHTGNFACGSCNGCYKYMKVMRQVEKLRL